MTHSIPGALGVFIRTNQGTVMHTGDFKLDQTPIDGVTPDYAAISRFAKQGIDLLLSDSTNATVPGFTKSEAEVGPNLLHAIKNAPGRVFVASFSSHIHRLQQICDAARKCGRKVVVTGRSMLTNTRVARELGYLNIDDADIIDAFDIDNLPDDKIVVMCTGSQGEPLSALSRMANGEHKTLSIHEGDTVILSATPVPGNEKAVQQVVNSLAKLGCDVWDKNRALVHVSGHGSQEELKLMIAMAKPTYFMPVHGEAVHLRAHAQLARKMGLKDDHIFILDNGDTLEMRGGIVKRGAPVESGVVYVDGLRIGDTDPIVLRDRQKLANDGMVTAVAIVSLKHKKIEAIEFSGRGVSFAIDDQFSEDASAAIMKTIEKGKFVYQQRLRCHSQSRARFALQLYLEPYAHPSDDHPGRHGGLVWRADLHKTPKATKPTTNRHLLRVPVPICVPIRATRPSSMSSSPWSSLRPIAISPAWSLPFWRLHPSLP